MWVVACSVGYGEGGLGRHFAHWVDAAAASGNPFTYLTRHRGHDGPPGCRTLPDPVLSRLLALPPYRWRPDHACGLSSRRFDRAAAAALRDLPPADRVTAFAGEAFRIFQAAPAGAARELVAANSHLAHVRRRHQRAAEDPLGPREPSWLGEAAVRGALREYERADRIWVGSEYSRRSFLEAGLPADRLARAEYGLPARFVPPASRHPEADFEVAYVGSLTAVKGVPLLVEAFRRLDLPGSRLTLVGGPATRPMRRYLAQIAADRRIRIAPGDPLPVLQRAHVLVHPAWEDGLAYAPLEALSCGTPVIVTEDTGMCEYVEEGANGFVVPTGSVEALVERLVQLRDAPLAGCSDLRPLRCATAPSGC